MDESNEKLLLLLNVTHHGSVALNLIRKHNQILTYEHRTT